MGPSQSAWHRSGNGRGLRLHDAIAVPYSPKRGPVQWPGDGHGLRIGVQPSDQTGKRRAAASGPPRTWGGWGEGRARVLAAEALLVCLSATPQSRSRTRCCWELSTMGVGHWATVFHGYEYLYTCQATTRPPWPTPCAPPWPPCQACSVTTFRGGRWLASNNKTTNKQGEGETWAFTSFYYHDRKLPGRKLALRPHTTSSWCRERGGHTSIYNGALRQLARQWERRGATLGQDFPPTHPPCFQVTWRRMH
jgi:hypothetical protein